MNELDTAMARRECQQYTVNNKCAPSAPTAPAVRGIEPEEKAIEANAPRKPGAKSV
jgi:hypothetical protein